MRFAPESEGQRTMNQGPSPTSARKVADSSPATFGWATYRRTAYWNSGGMATAAEPSCDMAATVT